MNLLRAHGSPTLFHTANGRHCDCGPCRGAATAYHAQNYKTRREARRAYNSAYLDKNRDEVNRRRRDRYAADDELRQYYIELAERRYRMTEGRYTADDVRAQFERQKGKCYWCKRKMKGRRGVGTWHVDHIVPVAKGGTNWPSNIVCACAGCNQKKSDAHPMDFAGMMF